MLRTGAVAAAGGALASACAVTKATRPPGTLPAGAGPTFTTDDARLQAKWDGALAGLRRNAIKLFRYPNPVLIEGGVYAGVWLECGPQEAQVFQPFAPAVARANHDVFFAFQREDGYIHFMVSPKGLGTSQIQMVVPIAATALEVFEADPDQRFLETAYAACSRWDDWLVRYRNTRGTGLCEAFCGNDTGHDNSPRFAGLPAECPDGDARKLPRVGGLPYLAPDLSATVFGGRLALAKMANILGRGTDNARWLEKAEAIRAALMRHCFDPDDACFYDRDKDDRLVRMRHDALSRVVGEHMVDRPLFAEVYRRHLRNPEEFWSPHPFPSIAINDPAFDHNLPRNSWGGASQALTALRAPAGWSTTVGAQI